MTREEAKGNLIHAIRWNDIPNKEALNMAIKALEQEPCEDAMSRQMVIDGINEYFHDEYYQRTSIQDCRDCLIEDVIKPLSPVYPKPRMGHWILVDNLFHKYKCSECGDVIWTDENHSPYMDSPYCCKCGYKMIESQESEE